MRGIPILGRGRDRQLSYSWCGPDRYCRPRLAGGVVTHGELVEALGEFVDGGTGNISAYNCELIEAFDVGQGANDPTAVLEADGASAD